MKKYLLCWILVLVCQGSTGQTAFKVNQYNVIYKGKLMPVATLFTMHDFGNRWAFYNYFYVNGQSPGSWGEALAGPAYSVTKWLNVSLLGGMQSNEDQLFRGGPLVIIKQGSFAFFCAMEFGGKRYRWDAMAFYLRPPLKMGAELIRNYQMYAVGPRVEYSFLKSQPLTVFYSALWDFTYGNYASMFGLYTAFPPSGK